MNALGRGLASLIPKRDRDSARDVLDRIDSMEELPETPAPTKPAVPVKPKRHVSVVEESADAPMLEDQPMPEKPLVTPLSFEPDDAVPAKTPAPETPVPVEEVVEDTPEPEVAPIEEPAPEEEVEEAQKKAKTPMAWDRHEERVQHIAIGDIDVNPLQPRRTFDPTELEELMMSMQQHGILQPLVVARKGERYEIIAGERRLRAAKNLGWERVPGVVRYEVDSDQSRLELALLENLQRRDLNPIEEALAYKQLTDEYGMSQEEIAQHLGRNRVTITNMVRLLLLPAEVQRGLVEGKITAGHARTVLMIPDKERQINFYHHIINEGLTVRKSEVRARRIQRSMMADDNRLKQGRTVLARRYVGPLEDQFGFTTKVRFNYPKNYYEVVFRAHSESELNELMGKLIPDFKPSAVPIVDKGNEADDDDEEE